MCAAVSEASGANTHAQRQELRTKNYTVRSGHGSANKRTGTHRVPRGFAHAQHKEPDRARQSFASGRPPSMDDANGEEPQPTKHKHSSSKYDFVKVRVWLKDRTADGSEHYYVLSRFLVSRMLAVTQMQYRDSIRLALELKKHLVDRQVRACVCGSLVRACVSVVPVPRRVHRSAACDA